MHICCTVSGASSFGKCKRTDVQFFLLGIMLIIFDTTVLALSLFKLSQLWRINGFASKIVKVLFRKYTSLRLTRTSKPTGLNLCILAGDQVVFYILTFTVNVTNITVYYAARGPGGSGKDFMSPVTTCVTAMAVSSDARKTRGGIMLTLC